MKALDRKLYRDVLLMKGQTLAITAVLASGIAMFIMCLSTYRSLSGSQTLYYDAYYFGDVFASLKRAPNNLREKIDLIPGVARTQTRIVRDVSLDLYGLEEVATARLVSLPIPYRPDLNAPYLRSGRFPEPGHESEVLVSEMFAEANGLISGDSVTAIINGRRRALVITGIALSPEFIYSVKEGDVFPDNQRFGVFWMSEKALAAAFNMEGAFNNVSLKLNHGAFLADVLARLNRILEPYGGLDPIGRKDQVSHWFLTNELTQLKNMGFFIPIIFFAVAIFLLNMVLSRVIQSQREQIGVLKAFGYTHWQIGSHFLKYVVLVVVLGTVVGLMGGYWLGSNLTDLYGTLYRFPVLQYELGPDVVVLAFLLGLVSSALGTLGSVRKAVDLPPAEAMRPEPPASYKPTLPERMGLSISPQMGMILRHLERQPLRTGLAVLGIALAAGLVVLGRANTDAIMHLMDVHFTILQRQDVNLMFYEPKGFRAFHEIRSMPGVIHAEPIRNVPIRLRFENRTRRTGIIGLQVMPTLQRPLDEDLKPIPLPDDGVVIGRTLANVLGVGTGDLLSLEILEGTRPVLETRVERLIDEFIGANVYMNLAALNRIMGQDRVINGAYLTTDPLQVETLYSRLKNTPGVAGVTAKKAALQSFEETMAESIKILTFFNILFSCIIAFGVVYNSAQMALTERGRDLATLRVLGFTRAEISAILLGELAVITLIAIPIGFLIGYGLSAAIFSEFQTELFRIPLIISRSTYGAATVTIIVSALISGLVVRRKLDRLDLVAVLKTRE